mgnify:CR=1 FL=1
MGFNCTQCGLCCERMGKVKSVPMQTEWMQKLVDEFPYGTDENGVCMKYKDGLCTVYDNRPLLCNIERIADEVDIGMTKEAWFKFNEFGCKVLQQKEVA